MKNYTLAFTLILSLFSKASIVVMPRVEASLFIHNPQTDFEKIYIHDPVNLQKSVEWLFEQNKLLHSWTKSVNNDNTFLKYWPIFQNDWHLIDMNNDGTAELIFSGKPAAEDEKEMFSLYAQFGAVWKEIYWDDGHLLAYKIHPRTKEILLYQHRYPCCTQSTHAVNRLRYLNNKVYLMKRIFLARDTEMKGHFFPNQSNFSADYRLLDKKTMLYWSKGKIKSNAAQFIPTNEIIHYPISAVFKVLAKEDNWLYVQMITPPVNEPSKVANAANLSDVKVLGWIEDN